MDGRPGRRKTSFLCSSLTSTFLLPSLLSLPVWVQSLRGMACDTDVPFVAEHSTVPYSLYFDFCINHCSALGLCILILLHNSGESSLQRLRTKQKESPFVPSWFRTLVFILRTAPALNYLRRSEIFYYSTNTWENLPLTMCLCPLLLCFSVISLLKKLHSLCNPKLCGLAIELLKIL